MKVKVLCPCSAKFEFEVEPVNGRMPMALGCPVCGADATALANAVIQQQLSAAVPVAQPAPIAQATPVEPVSSGLRISKPHAAAPSPVAAATPAPVQTTGIELCPKHKLEQAVETCRVCGKPICLKCMEQFGYLCGVYCRQQAELQRISIPAYAHQKKHGEDKSFDLFKRVTLISIAVAMVVAGVWIWYAWFARNPKIVYSLPFPVPKRDSEVTRPEEFYQLIGPGQLLSVKSKHAGLFDITKQSQIWSVALQTDAEAAAAKAAQEKKNANESMPKAFRAEVDYDLSDPLVAVTTNDIWLSFRDRVLRLDRKTGERKEPAIFGQILNFTSTDEALMVVYLNHDEQRTLTRISLPDGTVQTADLSPPSDSLKPATQILADKKLLNTNLPKLPPSNDASIAKLKADVAANMRRLKTALHTNNNVMAPAGAPDDYVDEMASFLDSGEQVPPFTLAGPNVIEFNAKLLEKKLVPREGIKPKGKSVLDDNNLTASQGLDLAQEMINDSQREANGGMEYDDLSRYQVTLHRWFATDVPDWTGEVVGPPVVYSLKTVDLLVAGQSLVVFDKHNKKLWQAKLTYAPHVLAARPPCVETADALYFADPGGLTRFDLATGNVRWRMESVGISSLQIDARNNIYLSSTTASPDQILHPHEVNFKDKIRPILMKVNPETGSAVWQQRSIGSECLMSGKFLYATWVTSVRAALRLEDGPDTHYTLRLLDPSNGYEIWLRTEVNHSVLKTEIQNNWVLLQFNDEVRVLKFFSL